MYGRLVRRQDHHVFHLIGNGAIQHVFCSEFNQKTRPAKQCGALCFIPTPENNDPAMDSQVSYIEAGKLFSHLN